LSSITILVLMTRFDVYKCFRDTHIGLTGMARLRGDALGKSSGLVSLCVQRA
jgi:hypothetical protein